jgi:nitrate/TMAO reductase-like tetraheme cytochrome c subunit
MSLFSRLKDPTTRAKFILYLGAIIIVVAAASGWAMHLASTPGFCGTCHVVKPYITAWEKSSHANVTCSGCHGRKGVVPWLYGQVLILEWTYLNISERYEKPINRHSELSMEIESEICQYCHTVPKKVTASPGIKINHQKHAEKEIGCTVCHNRIAHPGVTDYKGEAKVKPVVFQGKVIETGAYPDRMKMRYCMKCHTGGKGELEGPRDCNACHPKDFDLKPKNHIVAGFLKPPLDTKVRAVHSQGAKLDQEYCLSCHEKKFCSDCHGMDMPHPAKDWTKGKQEHVALGKAKPQSCQLCHPQTKFCTACHHPDWKPAEGPWWSPIPGQNQHKPVVLAKGAAGCFKCHDPRFCARCHVTGELLLQ